MKYKLNKLALALFTSVLMIGQANAATGTTTFGVTAEILGSCTVTADDMDFGIVDISVGDTATSRIYLTCPEGINAFVTLNGGNNLENEQRRMLQSVGGSDHFLDYGLYTDSGRNNPFATFYSNGFGGVSIITTGVGDYVDVYGDVPVQTAKPGGTYTDVINVLVTY